MLLLMANKKSSPSAGAGGHILNLDMIRSRCRGAFVVDYPYQEISLPGPVLLCRVFSPQVLSSGRTVEFDVPQSPCPKIARTSGSMKQGVVYGASSVAISVVALMVFVGVPPLPEKDSIPRHKIDGLDDMEKAAPACDDFCDEQRLTGSFR
ncbi:hypothetical protein EJ04DRAFT_517515 [Polyplosphaeria fusca]|uniref:Uncharacterized protein n=1 Tax=Polyplosphaeria fusca TaxID=682080 RepID=A0A9P4QIQ6_9PLEO|nr:hypothetical protein EJ04DRAFT_517515 [Polyplosphaeria fusca]